jgi:hypothetical protein
MSGPSGNTRNPSPNVKHAEQLSAITAITPACAVNSRRVRQ